MRLNISNFAKIKSADIVIDGITVIAGENNTGKSTIGKILFSLFNSVSGIEEKILKQRIAEIGESSRERLRNNVVVPKHTLNRNFFSASKRIAGQIAEVIEKQDTVENEMIHRIIEDVISKFFSIENKNDWQSIIEDISNKVIEILELSEYTLVLEILTGYFNKLFHAQINSLNGQNDCALLDLMVKNKNVSLKFEGNECTYFSSEINLLNKAIYIDDPFIINKLSPYEELNITEEFLRDLISGGSETDVMEGIIGKVLAKEKITEIYQTLQTVVDGQIIQKNEEEFYLENKAFDKPISFKNLSAGLKSFVIIKMLVEKGAIKEKDVLILDEPEIHLHPQWQVTYAELIVLLQKYFDLSIVVTTHSPYFLDAIDLFSVKHGLKERTNYYLSSMENNEVEMVNVTDNIELIYQKMASPIQMLDSLRYELNNN